MSSTPIKEFLVSLGFAVNQKGLNKFQGGIKQAGKDIGKLGLAFGVVNALLGKFVFGVAKEFESLGRLSERVNSNAESIQRLGYVASLNASSVEAVNSSLDNLNQMVGQASLGVGRGALVFKKLGIAIKDSNGRIKQTTTVLDEVKKKLVGLEKSQQLGLLSKIGIDPTLLRTLTDDVSELENEFNKLYGTIGIGTEKAIEASIEFNDEIYRTKFAWGLLRKSVVLEVMPQITRALGSFRKSFVDSISQNKDLLQSLVKKLIDISKGAVLLFQRVFGWVGLIVKKFGELNKATDGWAGYLAAALIGWKLLNKGILATPLGRLIQIGVAMAALVDDYLVWKEGGKSFFDWSEFQKSVDDFLTIRDICQEIWSLVKAIGQIITGDWIKGAKDFDKAIDKIIEKFSVLNIVKRNKETRGTIGYLGEEFRRDKRSQKIMETNGPLFYSSEFADNPMSAVSAALSAQRGMEMKGATINQETKIIVQGSSDPMTTAHTVAAQQSNVNRDLTRDFAGAVQ